MARESALGHSSWVSGAPRVLIIDDDEAFARTCARMLRRLLHGAPSRLGQDEDTPRLGPGGDTPQPERPAVECAYSVQAALVVIRGGDKLDGVWCDRHIPDAACGAQVLRAAAAVHPEAVLLMVTADPPHAGTDELPPHTRVFHKGDAEKALAYLSEQLQSRRR